LLASRPLLAASHRMVDDATGGLANGSAAAGAGPIVSINEAPAAIKAAEPSVLAIVRFASVIATP
jgi:hypothetical protein